MLLYFDPDPVLSIACLFLHSSWKDDNFLCKKNVELDPWGEGKKTTFSASGKLLFPWDKLQPCLLLLLRMTAHPFAWSANKGYSHNGIAPSGEGGLLIGPHSCRGHLSYSGGYFHSSEITCREALKKKIFTHYSCVLHWNNHVHITVCQKSFNSSSSIVRGPKPQKKAKYHLRWLRWPNHCLHGQRWQGVPTCVIQSWDQKPLTPALTTSPPSLLLGWGFSCT